MASIIITDGKSGLIARVSNWFADLGTAYDKYQTYRTTFEELRSLSDRDLTDLGIGRSDIQRIAYESAYGA